MAVKGKDDGASKRCVPSTGQADKCSFQLRRTLEVRYGLRCSGEAI